eukprot:scaffold20955_cov66-Phaeocystis_antarctica.AAC.4
MSGNSSGSSGSSTRSSNTIAAACHSAALAARVCSNSRSSRPLSECPLSEPSLERAGSEAEAASDGYEGAHQAAHRLTEALDAGTARAVYGLRLCSLHGIQLLLKAPLVLLVHHGRLLCLGITQSLDRLLEGSC